MVTFFQQYLGASVEAALDVDKVRSLLAAISPRLQIPPRFHMILYKASALDCIQFHRYEDFRDCIRPINAFCKIPSADVQGAAVKVNKVIGARSNP